MKLPGEIRTFLDRRMSRQMRTVLAMAVVAAIAFVLGIRTRDAFLAITAGVLIAGMIMSVLAYGSAALIRLIF